MDDIIDSYLIVSHKAQGSKFFNCKNSLTTFCHSQSSLDIQMAFPSFYSSFISQAIDLNQNYLGLTSEQDISLFGLLPTLPSFPSPRPGNSPRLRNALGWNKFLRPLLLADLFDYWKTPTSERAKSKGVHLATCCLLFPSRNRSRPILHLSFCSKTMGMTFECAKTPTQHFFLLLFGISFRRVLIRLQNNVWGSFLH